METSIALMALILAILNALLRQRIVGEKREKISETDGKIYYIVGNFILGLIAFYVLFFVLDRSEEVIIKWFWLILMIIIYSFSALIECKYLKNSKEYVVTVILLLFGLLYFFLFIF